MSQVTLEIHALCVEIERLKLMQSTNKSPFGTSSLAMSCKNFNSSCKIDYHCGFSKNERTQRDEVYVADYKLSKTTLQ